MKYNALLFINIIFPVISIVPVWKLSNSAIDLFKSTSRPGYMICHRYMYELEVKLSKSLQKSDGITQENKLTILLNFKQVNYENIESFYKLSTGNIICPRGKFHPIENNGNTILKPDSFVEQGNWDLKCYYHWSGFFLLFYLRNGNLNYFISENNGTSFYKIESTQFFSELYDFKLVNDKKDNGDYPMAYLAKRNNKLIIGSRYLVLKSDCKGSYEHDYINITDAKAYTQAYFNNYTNDFYYFTYNNINDFECGVSTSTVSSSDYTNLEPVSVKRNIESPFEFIEEAEIREINILLNTKYAYYTICNTKNETIYHGILDLEKNIIIYNTDDDIDVFIPINNHSMLAITSKSAYQICIIKGFDEYDDVQCVEECNENVLYSSKGNICGRTCESDKILLMPAGFCNDTCDENYYILNENQCNFCKSFSSTNKYKLINSPGCLDEIPDGAEVYNSNLFLLNCKSGYKVSGSQCIPDCYEFCETCTQYSSDETNQYCITCKTGYKKDENNNCILIPVTDAPTTVLTSPPSTTEVIPDVPTTQLLQCENEKCLTCSEESLKKDLCLSCNEEKGYKKVNYTIVLTEFFDCILNTSSVLKKYYYNEIKEEYRPCYKSCKSCLIGGDAESNNCLECEKGYMFRPGDNPKNNCVVASEFFYISPYGQYKPLIIYQCPDEAKFYLREKKLCLSDCTKDEEYKYLYEGNCMKECPAHTSGVNYICIENKEICSLGENELFTEDKDDLKLISALVKSYLAEFNYTNNHISLYKNNDYSLLLYKNKECINEFPLDLPAVDFQLCYERVKNTHNIEDDLIIVLIYEKLSKNLSYSFYHPISGKKLDAEEICKNEDIKIQKNITSLFLENSENKEILDIQSSFVKQGIDIFDINSPFYNDLCFRYDNPSKKDIPLSARVKDIFPNITLCETGCQSEGIDLEKMTVICNCKFNNFAKNDIIQNSGIAGSILTMINSSNILVLKCYKYIFKYFKKSFGGIISLILLLSHIICSILYFLFGLTKLQKYILNLMDNYLSLLKYLEKSKESHPPKKNNENNDMKFSIMRNKKKIRKKDLRTDTVNSFVKKKSYQKHKKIKKHSSSTNLYDIKNSNIILIAPNLKYEPNLDEKNPKETNIKIETNIINNDSNEKRKIFFENYLATSLDDMEYDDALVKDQRTFWESFGECLKEKQFFIHTFIANDPIKIRSIKIILFILNIALYFVINGLFINEEYIEELYEVNEEEEHFFSYITRSIDEIFYSSMISIIIDYIIECFFIEEKKIIGIFKREKESVIMIKFGIVELIRNLKKRYLSFIITVFIVLIFSFYYLLCFNYVYPNAQIEWIKSSITLILFMQIISVLKCFLQTLLRNIGIRCHIEKIYKLSKLLE